MTAPTVSVVLPCYRAAPIVMQTVDVLCKYLAATFPTWEIIVVDDGANDFQPGQFDRYAAVRLVSHPRNLGKGAAVRTGMLAARGKVRIFTDADMPYDRELIPVMTDYIQSAGFHLVIGDRTLPGSHYAQDMPASRRTLSAVASRVIGSLVTGGFFDTQCGIKAVRGDVADALFPMIRTQGFAFDVEVVYVALKHGLDIKRIPVRLRRNFGTTVRPLVDALQSTSDLLHIKARQLRGQYHSEALQQMLVDEFASALLRTRFTMVNNDLGSRADQTRSPTPDV